MAGLRPKTPRGVRTNSRHVDMKGFAREWRGQPMWAVVGRVWTVASIVSCRGAKMIWQGAGVAEASGVHWRQFYARQVRLGLEELGLTFVKVGQLLSTRSDLLPAARKTSYRCYGTTSPPFRRRTSWRSSNEAPDRLFPRIRRVRLDARGFGLDRSGPSSHHNGWSSGRRQGAAPPPLPRHRNRCQGPGCHGPGSQRVANDSQI
jgi:hypothetical protein